MNVCMYFISLKRKDTFVNEKSMVEHTHKLKTESIKLYDKTCVMSEIRKIVGMVWFDLSECLNYSKWLMHELIHHV